MAFSQVTTQRQIGAGISAPRRDSPRPGGSRHRTLTPQQRRVKRAFDVVVSLLLICLVLPLMLLVALLLYVEDTAPVLQKEVKLGATGLLFPVYKFRTRPRIVYLRRASRLEQFLAVSGIDRLPMLFNVLEGHMSLVGPELLAYKPGLILTDARRADLQIAPGLCHVRDERSYVEHYNLWSDVRVLAHIVMLALK
ncbi:MAG: sugar transferase [Anaerolineae bacterium]|nr:sugar transferase [Anaerolineae bacterium]